MKIKINLVFLFFSFNLFSFNINRVILATNCNPMYLDFWPIVAKVWKEKIGIQPTLALIEDEENINIDESLGDIIRFKPIPNIPSSLYTQTIRLLLPAFFPNDFCILSDIDMLPISRTYFLNSVKDISDEAFVVYKQQPHGCPTEYRICYVAAKGSTFEKMFEVKNISDIPIIIESWWKLNYFWPTDQRVLYQYVEYSRGMNPIINLNHDERNKMMDKIDWPKQYDKNLLENYYQDCHMLRPYSKYKKQIDELLRLILK